jgi:hypothetical protein
VLAVATVTLVTAVAFAVKSHSLLVGLLVGVFMPMAGLVAALLLPTRPFPPYPERSL